jgi:protein-disulfide isomerase
VTNPAAVTNAYGSTARLVTERTTAVLLILTSTVVTVVSLSRHATVVKTPAQRFDELALPREVVPTGDADYLGSDRAPLAVIAFLDFACPYSRDFAQNTLPTLVREYVSTGRVQFIWREFPVHGVHPTGRLSAECAVCAGRQGKLTAVFDELFRVGPTLTVAGIQSLSKKGGLREPEFEQCVLSRGGLGRVVQDQTSGRAIGVYATPTFFIGTRAAGHSVAIKMRMTGSENVARFRQVLNDFMKQQ